MTSVSETTQDTDDLLLERQLCFALTVASRSVVGVYKPVLERLGLTHPQYLVMLALWERSPRTLKDISDSLLHEPATLSPLLKRLEEAELITRERVTGNERALAIRLTDKGAALREQATAVPGEIRERLQLSREEVAELHQAMTGLIAATQRSGAHPSDAPSWKTAPAVSQSEAQLPSQAHGLSGLLETSTESAT